MRESEISRRKMLLRALLLGSGDMAQAAAAAEALQQTESSEPLARALETAMAVCYMRPFTRSTLWSLEELAPTEGAAGVVHADLKKLRNLVYAHTDRRGGRQAEFVQLEFEGEMVSAVSKEMWRPYPRENLPIVIDLCSRLRDEMRTLAAGVQRDLQAVPDRTVPPSVPPPSTETAD